MGLAFSLVLVVVFLVLVGLFAGSETGFVSLDLNLLKHNSRENNAWREKALLKIVRQPERFLALTLIGTNMCIVIATSISANLAEEYGPFWVSVETLVMSVVIFAFCEVLPKMAFSANPMQLSLRIVRVIEVFDRLLSVPILVITSVTRTVMSLMGLRSDERKKRQMSRDELLILLGMGASSGVISERPHRMAKGIIGLKETRVCEIMIPRVKVIAAEVTLSLDKIRRMFIDNGYSRIPIYESAVDQIIGIVYFKDVFLKAGEKSALRELVKPVLVVPESKNAYELFREMMNKKMQAAMVLDEFGVTSGLVTLEDLIEEVVGEIHDELDESSWGFKFHDDGTMTVRADYALSALAEEGDLRFADTEGITTLNGLIMSRSGRIPATGECLIIDGMRMEILQADQRRVMSVRIFPHGIRKEA